MGMNLTEHEKDMLDEKLTGRAIDDLIDRMLDGQEYPPRANFMQQINLTDIMYLAMTEMDNDTLRDSLARAVAAQVSGTYVKKDLDAVAKHICRFYFEGAGARWVERRVAEMKEEETDLEESDDRAFESTPIYEPHMKEAEDE